MPALTRSFGKTCRRSEQLAMKVRCSLWAAIVFLLSVAASSVSQSDEHRVDRASVLERGIFQAQNGPSIGRSSFGLVTKVRDVSLVQSTTTIPARRSLRFGLRYVITGTPAGAEAEVRLITRFPEVGLLDPITGVRHHESEHTTRVLVGAPAYREFRFDQSWEIVSGEWVFEFWHAGRKIGMQKFCVIDAELAPDEAARPLQRANCAFLIGRASSSTS